jgi:hypothetical protein
MVGCELSGSPGRWTGQQAPSGACLLLSHDRDFVSGKSRGRALTLSGRYELVTELVNGASKL